jgi:hypothetical protein
MLIDNSFNIIQTYVFIDVVKLLALFLMSSYFNSNDTCEKLIMIVLIW